MTTEQTNTNTPETPPAVVVETRQPIWDKNNVLVHPALDAHYKREREYIMGERELPKMPQSDVSIQTQGEAQDAVENTSSEPTNAEKVAITQERNDMTADVLNSPQVVTAAYQAPLPTSVARAVEIAAELEIKNRNGALEVTDEQRASEPKTGEQRLTMALNEIAGMSLIVEQPESSGEYITADGGNGEINAPLLSGEQAANANNVRPIENTDESSVPSVNRSDNVEGVGAEPNDANSGSDESAKSTEKRRR